MDNLHAYEIAGNVVFRRPGNAVRHLMECTVIRTQVGFVEQLENGAVIAGISIVATGFERLMFSSWFTDWEYPSKESRSGDAMDVVSDNHLSISGRFIEVAVETSMLSRILKTGEWIDQHYIDAISGKPTMWRDLEANQAEALRFRPYNAPLVAIRISNSWLEPCANGSEANYLGHARRR